MKKNPPYGYGANDDDYFTSVVTKNPVMNEMQYTEMLERAFADEAEGIEFYQHFLNMIPNTESFRQVRSQIDTILHDEKMHLTALAQLIDAVEE